MLELLPELDAVLCHGGMGTVTEALAHGVPLVVAPIRADQPAVARQVTQAGAGLEVVLPRGEPGGAGRGAADGAGGAGLPRRRPPGGRVVRRRRRCGGRRRAACRLAALS